MVMSQLGSGLSPQSSFVESKLSQATTSPAYQSSLFHPCANLVSRISLSISNPLQSPSPATVAYCESSNSAPLSISPQDSRKSLPTAQPLLTLPRVNRFVHRKKLTQILPNIIHETFNYLALSFRRGICLRRTHRLSRHLSVGRNL